MAEANAAPADAAAVVAALEELIDPEKARFLPRFFRTGPGEYGEGDYLLGPTVPLQRRVARRFTYLDRSPPPNYPPDPSHEARLIGLLILWSSKIGPTPPVARHAGRDGDSGEAWTAIVGALLLDRPEATVAVTKFAPSPAIEDTPTPAGRTPTRIDL